MSKFNLDSSEIKKILDLHKKVMLKETKLVIKEDDVNQKCLVTKPQLNSNGYYTTDISYFYDPTSKKCVYGQGSTGFQSEDECTKACVNNQSTPDNNVKSDQIKVGFKFLNGLEILKEPILRSTTDTGIIVWIPTQDGGSTGNEFSCERHKNGKYYLYPHNNSKYTLTKEESKALYDKYCNSSDKSVGGLRDFIIPIFPDSSVVQQQNNTPTTF